MLRDAKVLARCEPDGSLRVESGRVEIRYRPGASKSYRAAARNLIPVEPAVLLPDATCPDDPAVARDSPTRDADEGRRAQSSLPTSAVAHDTPTSVAVRRVPVAQAAMARDRPRRGAAPRKDGGAPVTARGSRSRRGTRAASSAPAHQESHAVEEGAVVVYADGACSGNPGPAGVGVVVVDGDRRAELSEYLGIGTNNIAELTAILRAAERVCGGPARQVHIYTDSSYAIGVLSKGWRAKANQRLVADVQAALRKLAAVTLHHVPGHAGVPLNERADELARLAVQTRRTIPWT
jgi:ribonuclease HI